MEWIAHLLTLFVLEPMSTNGLYRQADWNMKGKLLGYQLIDKIWKTWNDLNC